MGSEVYNKKFEIEDLKGQPKESLHLLLDTIDGINRTMELKALLAQSMEATRIVMKSEASSLMLLDEDTGELYMSLPTGPVKEEIKGMRIPKSKGIGGWVVENRRPFLSNDVESTDFFFGDLADEFKTRNILCVPLIDRQNKVIGVLQAVNRRKEDFSPHDIPVFQALAAHITVAVERAKEHDKLHSQLKEKEVLLTEIHHRIKNNLAAIAGLIEMELPEVEDEHASSILRTTYTRIQSMTQVHDLLCQKGLFRDVELGLYLKQLAEKVEETMRSARTEVSISLQADNVHVPANTALLCGMILNEIVVNMYKHAFTGMDKGEISIHLSHEKGQIILELYDNGVGFSEKFESNKGSSIGMWIINIMLKKLDGAMQIKRNDGSLFIITFPRPSVA